jgi:hypothetical protein
LFIDQQPFSVHFLTETEKSQRGLKKSNKFQIENLKTKKEPTLGALDKQGGFSGPFRFLKFERWHWAMMID